MTDITPMGTGVMDRIRRDVNAEFARMESDYDQARDDREIILGKVMNAASKLDLVDGEGKLTDQYEETVEIMKLALTALKDKETAGAKAVSLKLKQKEQEIASAEVAAERLQVVIAATMPGKIKSEFSPSVLDEKLAAMFDGKITAPELRQNPNDISD